MNSKQPGDFYISSTQNMNIINMQFKVLVHDAFYSNFVKSAYVPND